MTAVDPVVVALSRAIRDHGRPVLDDPAMLRATMSDLLGPAAAGHRQDVEWIVTAVAAGAARALYAGARPDDERLLAAVTAAGVPRAAAATVTATIAGALHGVSASTASGGPDEPTTALLAADPAGHTRMRDSNRRSGAAGPTPGSRRGPILVAAAMVLAAVLAVGATLLATRGTADAASDDATSGATTTRTVTAAGSTVVASSEGVVTGATVTVPRTVLVPTVRPDQVVVDQFCTPLVSLPGKVDETANGWVQGPMTAATAKSANAVLASIHTTITQAVWTAEPSATGVPAAANRWRDALRQLRTELATGGTEKFSVPDWDQARLGLRLAAAGFLDECEVAGGAAPFTLDQATTDSACASVATPLSSAVAAVANWQSGTTAARTAAAQADLEKLIDAAAAVGADYRVNIGHPVRAQAETIQVDAYNLLLAAKAGQDPASEWVDRLESADNVMGALC